MKTYLDTSILFPALTQSNPNHEICADIFRKASEQGEIVCLSTHVYAELYANLTRYPLRKIHPKIAEKTILALNETVIVVDLNRADYEAALRRCAEKELVSGIIYDALHLQAAIKAEVDVFYTANERDFRRLWDEEIPFGLRGMKE